MTKPFNRPSYTYSLRRLLALTLMLLISLGLFMPLLASASSSNLPACCLRDGKHGCSMLSMRKAHSSSATIGAAKKCPDFPRAKATSQSASHLSLAPNQMFSSSLLAALDPIAQTKARYRVSFSRTRQKRGPPALLA